MNRCWLKKNIQNTKDKDQASSHSDDDEESDVAIAAKKVWMMGKSMGFLVNNDRELTKVLVRIKKRKNKRSKGRKVVRSAILKRCH